MGRLRVLVVTNVPAPYRLELFARVHREFAHFCVAFQAAQEPGRNWDMNPHLPYPVEYLAGFDVPFLSRRPRLNHGVADVIRRHDPDIVVAGGFSPTVALIARKCRRDGRRFVIMNDGTEHTDPVHGLEANYRRKLISSAAGYIAASQSTRAYFEKMGARASAIAVIQLTTDLVAIQQKARRPGAREEARSRLGVGGSVVCFVGQLVERKRPLDVIEAFDLAAREVPDLWLVMAGDGPLRDKVRADIKHRGLENVRLMGLVSWGDVLSIYAASDLQVFPVTREPYGMVVIEALAAGVPVISTPECGAAIDLVEDGKNGFMVEPRDTQAIAARIKTFFAEEGRAQEMSEAAQAVVTTHDVRHEAARFVESVNRFANTIPLPSANSPRPTSRAVSNRIVYVARELSPYRPALLAGLAASGVDTHVVVAGKTRQSTSAKSARPEAAGFAVHYPDTRRIGWREDILEICRRLQPATFLIEHGARLDFTWTLLLAPRLPGSTRILWSHGIENFELYSGLRGPGSYGRAWQISLADGLLCYDEAMARRLAQLHPGKVIGAAPNSTDGEPFLQARRTLDGVGREAVRGELGLQRGFYIAGLGRLIRGKGFRRLPAILSAIRQTIPSVGLILIGEGPERGQIEANCDRLGLVMGQDVVFAGEVRDPAKLARWLYCCDASVVPGYAGLGVVDSLFMGIPVVLAPAGPRGPYHSPEWKYLRETDGGLFAEDSDPESLSRRVIEYLSLPAGRRREIEVSTREYAGGNLGVGSMVRGIRALLERIGQGPEDPTRIRRT